MRRLSDLDSPGGPSVGPLVTVDAPVRGTVRADIAFEQGPDGVRRGVLSRLRRTGDTAYELVTTWFTDLSTDTPSFHDTNILFTSTVGARSAILEPALAGTRLVARASSGR